jgi:hypothetical protein
MKLGHWSLHSYVIPDVINKGNRMTNFTPLLVYPRVNSLLTILFFFYENKKFAVIKFSNAEDYTCHFDTTIHNLYSWTRAVRNRGIGTGKVVPVLN